MSGNLPLFDDAGDDGAIAAVISARLDCVLPEECIPGVAANARILQGHADNLRRENA